MNNGDINPVDELFGLDLSIPAKDKPKPGVNRMIHPDLAQPPFFMSIAAPRNSGKSFLIRHLLTDKNFYKGIWSKETIFIMCPSLVFNDDYKDIEMTRVSKISEMKIYIDDIIAEAEDLIIGSGKKKCPQILIILDDCMDTKLMTHHNIIEKLAIRGRHISISIIATAQKITGFSRSIRLNTDMFIIFACSNFSELEKFLLEYVPKKHKKFMEDKLIEIFEKEFQFVVVNNQRRQPSKRLRIGFSEIIQYPSNYNK